MGSRTKRVVLLLMVMCLTVPQMLAPMGAGAVTATNPRVGVEFLVCDAAGPQNQTDVLGDTIVWRDGRYGTCDENYDEDWDAGGDWDLYGMNAETLTGGVLVDAINAQNHPELGGNYMVWTDRRAAGARDNDDSDMNDIWMRDMTTGVEKVVKTDEYEQCRPNTDGKTIVWVDSRDYYTNTGDGYKYEDIYMYDIASGKESVVTTGTNRQRRPIVEGDYVVWRDWRNVGDGYTDLRIKNIRTGVESFVATQGAIDGHQFDGQTVAWYDNDSSPYKIKKWDFATKTTSVVATSTSTFSGLDMDGEWLVYQKYSSETDDDVYAYNMITGKEQVVCNADDCQGNPAVDNGLVAWNDNRDPDTSYPDIYGMYLDWTKGVEAPLSGANRFGTAVLASRQAFPFGCDEVVIATAYNWPDALAGGVLAAVLDCPVLLVAPGGVPAETAAEIERLNVREAYVVGGTSVISSAALEQVAAHIDGKISRIGGANRFQTSEMVAVKVKQLQGSSYEGKAFFATSANFPDALAGAPVAGALGAPILLADGSTLRDSTVAVMKSIGVKKGVVLGATSAVPAAVKTRIESVTATSAVRLGGSNRYGTSVEIAKYGVTNGMSWFSPALATGANFPDALAAGPMQARKGSVLLLTDGSSLSAETGAALKANKAAVSRVSFVGGVKVITNTVRNQVKALLQ